MKNLLIAFEGIDGSGKSTQIKLLQSRLEEAGQKVYLTCEPTHGPIGTLIREVFTGKRELDQKTIAALFVADRLEHILDKKEGMLQKLKEGYFVLTDRYYFSSFAYQSAFMPLDWIVQANSFARSLAPADLHIFVDVSPEQAMHRIQIGRDSAELYETLEQLNAIYKRYLHVFEHFQGEEQITFVDGQQTLEKVSSDIWNLVGEAARLRK